MIQEGFSPNTECRYLGDPMRMACRLGCPAAVEHLLEAGAEASEPSYGMSLVLESKVLVDQAEILNLLCNLRFGLFSRQKGRRKAALLAARRPF